MAEPRVITLKGAPYLDEDSKAGEAGILPGHLVEIDSAGVVVKHSTAGGDAARAWALERDEMGNGVNVAYEEDDVVKIGNFSTGMRVAARIESGLVNAGDFLESAGDGTLTKATSGVIVARALETGGANGPQLLRCEVY